ncbi:NACHT domain-containing protein [Hypoxylon cercidicola]|nr:NACHT domain-containing protein [Hypoxylon cercidicola]
MAPKLWQRMKAWKKGGKTQTDPTPKLRDQVASPVHSTHAQESSTTASGSSLPTTPVPAPIQTTSSDAGATLHPTLQGRLWTDAYDGLKREQPKLVDAYERLLSRELGEGNLSSTDEVSQKNDIDQANPKTRQIQFDRLLQAGLKKTEKEAAVKQNIQEAMDVVDTVKDWINQAVKSVPEAAIAWTSVCFVLEILANPIDEAVANRDGIAYVVSRMNWYWNLSHLLEDNPSDRSAGLRGELENQIIELYKSLLSYQMKSACLYYRNRLLVILRDVVKLDDWENTLQSIKDIESTIQRDFDTFTNSEINDHLRKLATTAESIHSDIYRAIQDQTATQQETRQKEKDDECLRALRVTDPRIDKTRITVTKGGLHRDSSNWILQHEDFQRWRNDDEAKVLWIKGDPGKGKTMLLIAIVDELEKGVYSKPSPSTVLSYFFCQGTNSNLNSASAVLRGLIYRLGDQKPSLISHLRKRYDKSGENLFNDENVFFALSEVLEGMLRDASLSRAYVVIDALDECENELQQLLKFIVDNSSALSHVKWIISSRNRHDIEWQLQLNNSGVKLTLELTQNAEQVSYAVNAYIDFKISQIESLQDDGELRARVLSSIREKADGTFLWVALVIQQLKDANEWDVLDVVDELPRGLDGIYDRMMDQINQYKRQNPQFCQSVLSAATLAYRPLRLREIAVLSGLPQKISDDLRSVNKIVVMCGSFLTIREGYVYLIHQSAKDYLSGETSRNPFSFKLMDVHQSIFSRSLKIMSALRRDIYSLNNPGLPIGEIKLPDPDPLEVMRYSCVYWIDHFCDFYSDSECQFHSIEGKAVDEFLRKKFIYWLEAMSLIGHMDNAVLAIARLESLLKKQSSGHEILDLVQDSRRFIQQNKWVIENAPLQTYVSALIFSPANCLTRKIFQNEEPEWITTKPRVEAYWSPRLQTVEGHELYVRCVAFSHDSKLLASGSDDESIKIWNMATGSLKQTLDFQGSCPISVIFSHDSKLLAAVSLYCVKIWNIETGTLIQTLDNYRSYSATFSPDSKRFAVHSGYTIGIWDVETGSSIRNSVTI